MINIGTLVYNITNEYIGILYSWNKESSYGKVYWIGFRNKEYGRIVCTNIGKNTDNLYYILFEPS